MVKACTLGIALYVFYRDRLAEFVRLNDYKISCAVGQVFYEYRKLSGVYWKDQVTKIVELEEFKSLATEKRFLFFWRFYGRGTYMFRICKGDKSDEEFMEYVRENASRNSSNEKNGY